MRIDLRNLLLPGIGDNLICAAICAAAMWAASLLGDETIAMVLAGAAIAYTGNALVWKSRHDRIMRERYND